MTAPEGPVWRDEDWVGAVLGAPVEVRLRAVAEGEAEAVVVVGQAAEARREAFGSVLPVGVRDVPFGVEFPPCPSSPPTKE